MEEIVSRTKETTTNVNIMVTLAATLAQMAIAVLSFCVRDLFKCCAAATSKPPDDKDDDEVDGMEAIYLNVPMTCYGAGATVQNEAIVRPKSPTSLPLETSV